MSQVFASFVSGEQSTPIWFGHLQIEKYVSSLSNFRTNFRTFLPPPNNTKKWRMEMVRMDIIRTPFSDFQILKSHIVQLSNKLTKSIHVWPVHYILTMYQTQHFLEILFLIQAKSGFHYHMRVGNHEIMVFGCIRMNISREFPFRYNLQHPCIKWNISRICCVCCKKKAQTLLWLSKALPVTN